MSQQYSVAVSDDQIRALIAALTTAKIEQQFQEIRARTTQLTEGVTSVNTVDAPAAAAAAAAAATKAQTANPAPRSGKTPARCVLCVCCVCLCCTRSCADGAFVCFASLSLLLRFALLLWRTEIVESK